MDPKGLLRSVHDNSLDDFKTAWSGVREFILIETMEDGGKSQGEALMRMEQMYQAGNDGAFALTTYMGCSDEYYQYRVTNEMCRNTYHHFCRNTSLRSCKSKVGKEGIIHVLRWAAVTGREAEKIMREWGFSPVVLNKRPCPVPAGVQAITNKRSTSSKAAPAALPETLAKGQEEDPADRQP